MSKLEEQIKEASFPVSGNVFAVFPKERDIHRRMSDGTVVVEKIVDRDYRQSVFKCMESDATRIVCREIGRDPLIDKPIIFHRSEWRIDNIDHLLPSLGFSVPERKVINSKA